MLNEMLGGSLETHLLAVSSLTSHLTSWALNVGKAFSMCPAGSSTEHTVSVAAMTCGQSQFFSHLPSPDTTPIRGLLGSPGWNRNDHNHPRHLLRVMKCQAWLWVFYTQQHM